MSPQEPLPYSFDDEQDFSFDDPPAQNRPSRRMGKSSSQDRHVPPDQEETFADAVLDEIDSTFNLSGCIISVATWPFRMIGRAIGGLFNLFD